MRRGASVSQSASAARRETVGPAAAAAAALRHGCQRSRAGPAALALSLALSAAAIFLAHVRGRDGAARTLAEGHDRDLFLFKNLVSPRRAEIFQIHDVWSTRLEKNSRGSHRQVGCPTVRHVTVSVLAQLLPGLREIRRMSEKESIIIFFWPDLICTLLISRAYFITACLQAVVCAFFLCRRS